MSCKLGDCEDLRSVCLKCGAFRPEGTVAIGSPMGLERGRLFPHASCRRALKAKASYCAEVTPQEDMQS